MSAFDEPKRKARVKKLLAKKSSAIRSPGAKIEKTASGKKGGIGEKKALSHYMGGAFGATPKRPVPEDTPRMRTQERTQRMKRLEGYKL